MAALQVELRARDAQKNAPRVCEPRATLQTWVQYSSVAARTVARISHVPQIGSHTTGQTAVALIFAHASGMVMVNVIDWGPGSSGARASFPDRP
jgi:hypothetical protein